MVVSPGQYIEGEREKKLRQRSSRQLLGVFLKLSLRADAPARGVNYPQSGSIQYKRETIYLSVQRREKGGFLGGGGGG